MSSNKNGHGLGRPRPVSALSSASVALAQPQSKQPSAAIVSPTLMTVPSFVRTKSPGLPSTHKLSSTPAPAPAPASASAPGLHRSRSTVHLPLYRRILFPTEDPSKPVPPLIVSPKGNGKGHGVAGESGKELERINERLYHLIALALRAYVLSWYTRFTASRTLPSEIHRTIIHPILSPILSDLTTEEGQERLCTFLLADLPTILALHVRVYWEARAADRYLPSNGGVAGFDEGGGEKQRRRVGEMYHARLPLLSVTRSSTSTLSSHTTNGLANKSEDLLGSGSGSASASGAEYTLSPLYLSTLSSAILTHHVGSNRPDVERLMAREVLSKSVLGSISRRLVEGWFWYMLVLKFLGEPGTTTTTTTSTSMSTTSTTEGGGREEKKRSEVDQEKNTSSEALKAESNSDPAETANDEQAGKGSPKGSGKTIDSLVIHYILKIWSMALLFYSALINLFTLYSEAAPAPASASDSPKKKAEAKARARNKRNPYARCWEPSLLFLREMLAIDGRAGLIQKGWIARVGWAGVEMLIGLFGPVLDRLLPHLIRRYLLTPQISLKLIDVVERLLFPLEGGWPGPSPVDPTPEEALELRLRAEKRLEEVVPSFIQTIFFPSHNNSRKRFQTQSASSTTLRNSTSSSNSNSTSTSTSISVSVEGMGVSTILDPLEDRSCNAHLVGMVLDNLVASIIPDLALPVDAAMDDGGADDLDGGEDYREGEGNEALGETDTVFTTESADRRT
ncbi:hypothetical protein IAT40_003170 [Kwoniella sp. CBS 6097]